MKYSKFLKALSKKITSNLRPGREQHQADHEKELCEMLVLGALDSLRQDHTHNKQDQDAIDFLAGAAKYAHLSKSQFFQDLWALWRSNFKKNGYFVEFGAVDGIRFSNSHILEKHFNWSGIVAEPNPEMWTALNKNRECYKSNSCVYSNSHHNVRFSLTERPELSGVSSNALTNKDPHQEKRIQSLVREIEVETITLNDLLEEDKAPTDIDYISIDTEGSEYDILTNFDFLKYNVKLFTIEHNRTENERLLDDLLLNKGYTREFSSMSLVDGFYVKTCEI